MNEIYLEIPYPPYNINKQQCEIINGRWTIYDINFETFHQSFVSLFVLSTLEGWPDYIMYAIDGSPSDIGPVFDNNQEITGLYILFIIIGGFFSVNLFVAMLSMQFNISLYQQKNQLLNADQENWIQMQYFIQNENIDKSQYQKFKNPLRKSLLNIIRHPLYELFILIVVLVNIVVMALNQDDITIEQDQQFEQINFYLTLFFIMEALFKIMIYNLKIYLANIWNKLDFYIVLASLIEILMSFFQFANTESFSFIPQLIRIFRVFRVTRLFKVVKSFQSLQKLIITIIFSLPALLNATSLLFLVYCIFSILGCYFFSNLTFLKEDGSVLILNINQSLGVEPYIGFENFLVAFLTLFRQSTGEDWHKIMYDTTRTEYDNCGPTSCGNLMQSYIMINLFILVLMQNLSENYINQDNIISQFIDLSEAFKETWIENCDQNNIYFMKDKNLVELYVSLPHPLGLYQKTNIKDELTLLKLNAEKKIQSALQIMKMNLQPDQNGQLFFNKVLFEILKNHFVHQKGIITVQTQQQTVQEIINAENKTLYQCLIIQKRELFKNTEQDQSLVNTNRFKINKFNPMIMMIYRELCFKTWRQYSLNANLYRQQHNLCENDQISQNTISTIYESDQKDNDTDSQYNGYIQQFIDRNGDSQSEQIDNIFSVKDKQD